MSKTANSSWETTGKPIVVLTVISLIVSLLLALVNGMTAPVIKENTRRTTLVAYVSVMPSVSDAATLEEVTDYTTANVTGVVKAPDGGIAIKAEEKGFDGGILTVIMGFDANGAETGIWVDASTQTKGIGSNVSTDDFLGTVQRHGRHQEHCDESGFRCVQWRNHFVHRSVCCHQ